MASSSFGSTKAINPYTTTSGKNPVGINKIMKITRRIVASIPVTRDKPPITPASLRLDLERANCFFIQYTSFSSYALSFLTFFSASFFMRGERDVFDKKMIQREFLSALIHSVVDWIDFLKHTTGQHFIFSLFPSSGSLKRVDVSLSDGIRFPVFCLFDKDRTGLCFCKEVELIF